MKTRVASVKKTVPRTGVASPCAYQGATTYWLTKEFSRWTKTASKAEALAREKPKLAGQAHALLKSATVTSSRSLTSPVSVTVYTGGAAGSWSVHVRPT